MEFTTDENQSIDISDKNSDKEDSEINLNILEEHFEELNVDPVLENKEQVDNLIKKYIRAIRLDYADEQLKKKMIRKLCELRVRQCELLEESEIQTVSGHQFKLDSSSSCCDICMKKQGNIYIPLLNNLSNGQQLNVCTYCGYSIHVECQSELFSNKRIRECPRLDYERQFVSTGPNRELNSFVILDICNEKALSDQEYKCNDCKELINFNTSLLCDYDGFYYCKNCHNNDQSIIPARIIHNWDFHEYPICKNSFYALNFIKNKPVLFNILELNSMLYGFIDELPIVKRLRYELNLMVKYIVLCKQPTKPKITLSNHLINSEQINYYSLSDLQDLNGLKKALSDFHAELFDHITKNCETCRGNGFYCELCPDKFGILFPFSPNISLCPKCHAVFHKNCYYRKKTCTRCKRIEKKETETVSTLESKESKAIGTESVSTLESKESKTIEIENKDEIDAKINDDLIKKNDENEMNEMKDSIIESSEVIENKQPSVDDSENIETKNTDRESNDNDNDNQINNQISTDNKIENNNV